jgi:RecA-family ATPase|tara:strand:- start:292 stop:1404 length:1113 start_codon:yes stop_codon:yes gene_type:complete
MVSPFNEEYRSSGGEVSSSSYSVDATRVHDSNTKLWVEPLGSILDKEYPKPEPLIEGLLHSGTQTIIYGRAGSGKSYITQKICTCLAGKIDFGYYKVTKAVKILYVDGEMLPADLQARYLKMKPKLCSFDEWQDVLNNLHYCSRFIQPQDKTLNMETGKMEVQNDPQMLLRTLEDKANMQQLMNTIEVHGYQMVVLDNIFTLFNFEDFSSPTEWLTHVQPFLNWCRQRNITVWIVDHARKTASVGGNSALFGSMVKSVTLDLLIQVETEKKEVDYDDDTDIEFTFKWHFEKARHLKAIEQEDVEFQIRNGDIEVVENLYKKQMILAKKYFEDGMALRKIEEQIMEDIDTRVSYSKINRWAEKEGWTRPKQ